MNALFSLLDSGAWIFAPVVGALLFYVGWFAFEETAGINAQNWK